MGAQTSNHTDRTTMSEETAPVELTRDYITAAIPFFLAAMFAEMAYAVVTKLKLYGLHDTVSSLTAGMMQTLLGIFIQPLLAQPYIYLHDNFRLIDVDPSSSLAWWITFVGIDLGYYWFHREAHLINLFWASHAPHHSSEFYNLSTALRQGAFQPFFSFMFYLPLAFFIPTPLMVFHSQWNTIYQFWIHTEVIGHMGPLEGVIVTPLHHSVHHSRNPKYIDKNFSGTLNMDYLFGTYERMSERPVYGLVHPLSSWDPLFTQYHHFVHIAKTAFNAKTFGDAFGAVFKGPGWTPQGELPLPEIEHPVTRYDVSQPAVVDAYIVLHFAINVVVGFTLLALQSQLSFVTSFAIAAFSVFSLTVFGLLAEGREAALLAERVRLAIIAGTAYTLSIMFPAHAAYVQLAYALVAVSFVWLVFMPRRQLRAKQE